MEETKDVKEQLFEALENGQISQALSLISKLSNLNIYSKNGKTPLHIAASKGYDSVIKKLVEKGADVNLTDKDGKTPLHISAHHSNEKAIAELLKAPKIQIDKVDNFGQTALHITAFQNSNNCAQLLMSSGCNINLCDNFGQTALHIAAYNKNTNLIRNLIDRNANTEIKDINNLRPIDIAGINEDISSLKNLHEKNLSKKDQEQQPKKVLKLSDLLQKNDNNGLNSEKNTHKKNENLLYNQLANDIEKQSELHKIYLNRFYNHKDMVFKYNDRNHESNKNSATNQDKEKKDDLDQFGDIELNELTKKISKGANFEALLIDACQTGQTKIAVYLISKVTNLNQTNGNGQTALHVAASNNNRDIVSALIRAGADLNIRDRSNKTAEEIITGKDSNINVKDINLLKEINSKIPSNSTTPSYNQKLLEAFNEKTPSREL